MGLRRKLGLAHPEGEEDGEPAGACARYCHRLRDWWQWNGPKALTVLAFLSLNAALFCYGYFARRISAELCFRTSAAHFTAAARGSLLRSALCDAATG